MSDFEKTQRRNNLIVGSFVVLALASLLWLIFKFRDFPVFVSKWKSYSVHVKFPVAAGVQQDTPVRFCGFQIGRVANVKPPRLLEYKDTGNEFHQTEVVLHIDKKYNNIPANVDVKVMSRGLGSSYIEFKAPEPDSNEIAGVLTDGILLQGSKGMTSEFFPEESQKKLDEIADSVAELLRNANDVIGDIENKENLKKSLANLSKATEQATLMMGEFKELAQAGKETMRHADSKIDQVVDSVVTTSEEFGKTTAQLRLMLEKINSGKGTASKMLNDGRLYESLIENSEQLELLLRELKEFIATSKDKGLPLKLK